VEDIVAIMIPEPKGREIVSLLERNITVTMYITIGTRNLQKYVSRTSVVFVSISFIVLMIISLAWLVFYYIQRFRYANARDRNQPNADCLDDVPIDYEGSLGGPPTNQITGASDTTVNESSVTLDPAVRTVGALQVVQDPDPTPQEGEIIFTTNKFPSRNKRSCMLQLKDPHVSTKTQCTQIIFF
ncbi:hypothetical protein FD755_017944, partial [Muntiacus reevesi]